MEEAGIISGYRAELNLDRVGRPLQAVVRLSLRASDSEFRSALDQLPEIIECVRVTGDDCHVMKVALASAEQLESLLDRLTRYGRTTTSIVLSAPLTHRVLQPVEPTEQAGSWRGGMPLRALP